MLIRLPLSLLSQRRNHIAQRAQALVDILRLPQPILIVRSATLLETLAARKVNEVEAALACLAREHVLAHDAQREDAVRA